MIRTPFLAFDVSSAKQLIGLLLLTTFCFGQSASDLGVPESLLERLPVAYRDLVKANVRLYSAEAAAYYTKQSDAEWTKTAIQLLFSKPAGKAMLLGQLEKEPDGKLRADILEAADSAERSAFFRPEMALTSTDAEILAHHAASDPSPEAALAALTALRRYHELEEKKLLEARRKQGDTRELSNLAWNRYAWFGETRAPLYLYTPPPVFTVVPTEKSIRVLAFGDFGTGSEGQIKDAAAMRAYHQKQPFDFGVTLGDNFYGTGLNTPDHERWQTQWEQLYAPMGIKFYPVFGNHDYGDPDSPAAEIAHSQHSQSWVFPAAYYSYIAGPVQFFAIDNIRLTDDELDWLDRELAKSTATWKLVYGHYHIYSATRGDNDTSEDNLIGRLLPLLEKHHVQVYLNGHDHNMQEARTESPVHFFTCGAGGAGLYDMKPTYKRSVFKDKQFGFTVLEADNQHFDVIFVDQDGKEVYRSHIAK